MIRARRTGPAAALVATLMVSMLSTLACSDRQASSASLNQSAVADETSVAAEPRPRRNIVLICLDTVRYDSFWAIDRFGPGDALSSWTERAVRFTRAQASAPWTIPSVASVMTGLLPLRHGAGSFDSAVANLDEEVPSALDESLPTFAEILSRDGHPTAAFVAHPWFRPEFGLARGYAQLKLWAGQEGVLRLGTGWIDARLQHPDEQAFLLYLHFMEAHEDHMKERAELDSRVSELPAVWRAAALQSAPGGICRDPNTIICVRYQVYVNAIRGLRQTVANLLQHLHDVGLMQETIVVLYSDHGEEFHDHQNEHERRGTDPRRSYGFGHGHSLYQELLHVPLVVWTPDRAGGEIGRPVSLLDIPPTIVSSQGLRWAGLSLLADDTNSVERTLISSGIAYGPEQVTALAWPYKRTVRSNPSERSLYHLIEDPREKTTHEGRTQMKRLDRVIAAYLRAPRETPTARPELGPSEIEDLRSLGYLVGHRSD